MLFPYQKLLIWSPDTCQHGFESGGFKAFSGFANLVALIFEIRRKGPGQFFMDEGKNWNRYASVQLMCLLSPPHPTSTTSD
jgi:hypothetical protein